MSYIHRTMIVPAGALTKMAQGLCEGLAGAGGAGMFVTELSATGSAPASHTISAGPIGDDFASLLPLTTVNPDGTTTTAPGDPAYVVELAAQAGITVTVEQVAGLLASVDVSDQEGFAALTRCGLQLVREATL